MKEKTQGGTHLQRNENLQGYRSDMAPPMVAHACLRRACDIFS